MIRIRRRKYFLLVICIVCWIIRLLFRRSSSIHREFSLIDEIHRFDFEFVRSDRCFTKSTRENVRRAIVVHFPFDRAEIYESELKWLYLSWIETIRNQPKTWQTDLLIYSSSSSKTILDQLNCPLINERSSKRNICFRIDYESIWKDKTKNLFRLIQQIVPSWCQHLDSLGILLDQRHLIDHYDYILRTDLDVFLTPHFAHYIPFDCSFQIGLGGYGFDYTLNRLSRIAQQLKLNSTNLSFIGSTWYAPPRQAILVAHQALWLTIWLSENEFTRIEKDHRLSILSWPQWYIGVVSMYSSHLAIHHFASRQQIHLIQKPFLIDYSCTRNTSFNQFEIIHIHAWHTNEMFSKFLFKNGSYDEILREKQIWNTNYSLDFILRIAWESKKFNWKDLRHLRELI